MAPATTGWHRQRRGDGVATTGWHRQLVAGGRRPRGFSPKRRQPYTHRPIQQIPTGRAERPVPCPGNQTGGNQEEACEPEIATTYFSTAKNTDFSSIVIHLELSMVLFIPIVHLKFIGSWLQAEMIYEIRRLQCKCLSSEIVHSNTKAEMHR